MKTLIFNGSPRKNGDTASLIRELTNILNGEIKIVCSYYDNIKPCLDCRHCWKVSECIIDDYMQDIYKYIKECDNIVIASPLYFSELSGSILNILSRLQMFFAARIFRNEELITKEKRGAVIICGGGDGSPKKAEETAKTLLGMMNAAECYLGCAITHNTNKLSGKDDKLVVAQVKDIARKLNYISEDK